MRFYDLLFLATLLFRIKIVRFDSESDSKYFCFHKQWPQMKHKSFFCWWDNAYTKVHLGSFYYKIYSKYYQITGCGLYTTQQGKNVHKIIFKWFRETIFVVHIAFSILYNMLLYYTSILHCFWKIRNQDIKLGSGFYTCTPPDLAPEHHICFSTNHAHLSRNSVPRADGGPWVCEVKIHSSGLIYLSESPLHGNRKIDRLFLLTRQGFPRFSPVLTNFILHTLIQPLG